MKIIPIKYLAFALVGLTLYAAVGCNQSLEEEVFDEIASNNFFQNDEDAITGVNAIYVKLRGANNPVTSDTEAWGFFNHGTASIYNFSEIVTDEMFSVWANSFPSGGEGQLQNFRLTPNVGIWSNPFFKDCYEGITIANNVLQNVENNDKLSEEIRNRVTGEALFGRALFYYHALSFYGNIPLILELNLDPFFLPMQADPAEVQQAIISDLNRAGDLLPASYSSSDYGRFTKGAALTLLSRLYLNMKRWDDAAETARQVIGLHSLSESYEAIFAADNVGNPEIIFSITAVAQAGLGNTFTAHAAQPDQVENAWGGTRVRDEFYDTFDPDDIRRSLLLKSYQNFDGEIVSVDEGALIMKYGVDENQTGAWAGNDIVVLRYADVLLTLSEALNELNGPNQESIDLINQLRARAFPNDNSKLLNLNDFNSKESLRSHILNERGWELYAEGYRREDLIRHGLFISKAKERGLEHASDFHKVYPIPQEEIDINPNLVQNPGY